jgi:hypothetical protein
MSDPVFNDVSYAYYSCDRDPAASEPTAVPPFSALPANWIPAWLNTTNNNYWICVDLSNPDALVWEQLINGNEFGAINQPRAYTSVASPAFSTPRQPNASKDVQVVTGVTLTSVVLGNATVTPQVSADNATWVSLAPVALLNATGSVKASINVAVPAGYYYQFISSTSGIGASASLDSVHELSN